MVSYKTKLSPVQRIEEMICLARGQRVMLDFDLAQIIAFRVRETTRPYRVGTTPARRT